MADIFIVDDDAAIRETLRYVLEEFGHTVYEAEGGTHALAFLREHPNPMVVLLDWLMPGMDGITLLQIISADRPRTPRHAFLLVTAAAITELRPLPPLPLDHDVTVIRKPFELDELLAHVVAAAERITVAEH